MTSTTTNEICTFFKGHCHVVQGTSFSWRWQKAKLDELLFQAFTVCSPKVKGPRSVVTLMSVKVVWSPLVESQSSAAAEWSSGCTQGCSSSYLWTLRPGAPLSLSAVSAADERRINTNCCELKTKKWIIHHIKKLLLQFYGPSDQRGWEHCLFQ